MDIQLHYVEKGSGPPLLLLHGNGENSDYFCRQIDYFQEAFHVYAPDTRGHGKSPRGTAPFTLEQFALDLKAAKCPFQDVFRREVLQIFLQLFIQP